MPQAMIRGKAARAALEMTTSTAVRISFHFTGRARSANSRQERWRM